MNDNQQNSYETGSTTPPKSHSGLIAVLLIAVILLCGITTALGLLNIRLTLALKDRENNRYGAQFSNIPETISESLSPTDQDAQPALGLRGQALSEIAQRFYRLPPGFWIQDVIPNGPADKAGLEQGDIILAINGAAVTDADGIRALLRHYSPGDLVQVMIFRDNQRYIFPLILTKSN